MYANYHTHTARCGHATGTEREYVENAIKGGCRILGFSDHTPQFYDGDFYPDREKMRPDKLEDYVDTVLALKKEYAGEILIRLGLEVEYFPKHFDELMTFLGQFPFEYLILGQHCVGNGQEEDPSVFRETQDPAVLRWYVRQCIEGMQTGRFIYLAHPDVLRYSGETEPYLEEMRRLCVYARELSMPLEINLNGVIRHRNYPNRMFWEIAADVGNTVLIGSDAHRAADVV